MSDSILHNLKDAQLVALILQRDHAAAQVLMERYHNYLATVLRNRGLQSADIENLIQETWLSALTSLEQASFSRPWLVTIACHAANHHYRKTLKDKAKVELSSCNEPGIFGKEQNAVDHRELLEVLKQHLDSMQFNVLYGIFVDGKKPAELEEDLGIKVTKVYELRRRGLQQARRILEQHGAMDAQPADS